MSDRLTLVKQASLAMQRFSWEQGTLAQAFLEAGDIQTAVQMAYEAVNRQTQDGRCAQMGCSEASTDACAIGEALLTAAQQTGDPALIAAHKKLLDWALHAAPRNSDGIVYHLIDKPQFWVDSFYMLPPFLASAGYYEEALHQIEGYWNALYDEKAGLMSHIWDDEAKAFVRKDHWGVGNGWALAGLTRVIGSLPDQGEAGKKYGAKRRELIEKLHRLLHAVLKYQMEDGAFHDILDDPASFREVNTSQMVAYAIYRGIAGGWLDRTLQVYADKARQAAQNEVDAYGFVHNVCGAPDFDSPGIAAEAQAFYILMEASESV